MSGIFLSYRRDDSAGQTGRLAADLRAAFPGRPVVRDVDTFSPGHKFVDDIDRAVEQADVVLAVMGRRWLTSGDLTRSDDYVRHEISASLAQDKRLIPVLVDGAKIPTAAELPESLRPLVHHTAVEITDAGWDDDVGRLVDALRAPESWVARNRRGVVVAGCLVALLVALAALLAFRPDDSNGGSPQVTTTAAVPRAFADSPDGRFRAELMPDFNYRVVDASTGAVVVTTAPGFPAPAGGAPAAGFSADSSQFAAGYRYDYGETHTWIGYWSTATGALLTSREVPGLLTSLVGQV